MKLLSKLLKGILVAVIWVAFTYLAAEITGASTIKLLLFSLVVALIISLIALFAIDDIKFKVEK